MNRSSYSAEVFAQQNADKVVEFSVVNTIYTGRVIGHYGGYVALIIPPIFNTPYTFGSYPIKLVVSQKFNTHDQVMFKQPKDLRVAPKNPVKPYPHTCKKCKSPARKCGSIVMCSNLKCKTRKDFSALIKKFPASPKIKIGTRENPIVIYCKECKRPCSNLDKRAVDDSGFGICYKHLTPVFTPHTFINYNWYRYGYDVDTYDKAQFINNGWCY